MTCHIEIPKKSYSILKSRTHYFSFITIFLHAILPPFYRLAKSKIVHLLLLQPFALPFKGLCKISARLFKAPCNKNLHKKRAAAIPAKAQFFIPFLQSKTFYYKSPQNRTVPRFSSPFLTLFLTPISAI